MAETTNLEMTLLTLNQSQKETTANTAFTDLDGAVAGRLSIATADANVTLTDAQALYNMMLDFTGALTAGRDVIVPVNNKMYTIVNSTSGGFDLTVKTSAGTGIAVSAGTPLILFCDGTNVISIGGAAGGGGGISNPLTSADAVTLFSIDNTAADGDVALAFTLSSTAIITMGVDDGDGDKFKIGTTAIGTSTWLTIDTSGNVGIGQSTPTSRLHVFTAIDDDGIRLENTVASNEWGIFLRTTVLGQGSFSIEDLTAAVGRFSISDAGLVGIGAQIPATALEIEDANATETAIQISNTSTGDPVVKFALSGVVQFTMGVDDSDSDKFKIGSTAVQTSTAITITSAQFVGIGPFSTAPAKELEIHVGANDGGGIHFNHSTAGNTWDIRVRDVAWVDSWGIFDNTSGEAAFLISNNGFIGMGASATVPNEKLEVTDSNAVTIIEINNEAADGDPALAFALSSVKIFTMGVDDGDGDKFKIGSTAIGTSTFLTIDQTAMTFGMGDDVLILRDTNAGLTASVTQTQGNGALTAEVNEVATVANANDTVTLPTAVAGLKIVVINNGANTLQIFPASSDDLGAGVDTATTLAAGSNVTFQAYDATNYEVL